LVIHRSSVVPFTIQEKFEIGICGTGFTVFRVDKERIKWDIVVNKQQNSKSRHIARLFFICPETKIQIDNPETLGKRCEKK
jgi:hypothetical protein